MENKIYYKTRNRGYDVTFNEADLSKPHKIKDEDGDFTIYETRQVYFEKSHCVIAKDGEVEPLEDMWLEALREGGNGFIQQITKSDFDRIYTKAQAWQAKYDILATEYKELLASEQIVI